MITETVHSFGDADEESPCADIHPPAKRRCLEIPTARCNVNKAKELIVGWIVTANLPFTAPSNPYLQRILELHDASLAKEVPWSRQSVRGTMRKLYEAKKGTISRQLEKAVTRISFSFDMWTSPNRYAFLGLHAHYLDASYQVQSRLLALRRVWGCHSGDNQATTVYGIFGEYGIRGRIGAGVCDNVSSNDTCLASLYRQLRPAVTKEDISAHRTRCFGHIINLAARAFLWGEDPDSFEREAFTEAVFQVEERELRLWRKRGAVGKLHNVVRFIRASSQRRELMKSLASDRCDEDDYQLFEEERAAIDLELMQNNETRWNSTFLMIQRAIRKREQIDHFIAYLETKTTEPRQRLPVEDHLSPQDWLLLAEIQSLLKPLYEITMRCQGWAKEGRYGALWEVMIGMEYLLNFFEEQKLLFSPPDANADDTRNAGASATTSTPSKFMFAYLMSILLTVSQDTVLYELTRMADARDTCPSTPETNTIVHFCKLNVLMMITDDAYKFLSITVGQSLTSITAYLANPPFTRLLSSFTRAGTCPGLRRTGPAASNWCGYGTLRAVSGNILNNTIHLRSGPMQ